MYFLKTVGYAFANILSPGMVLILVLQTLATILGNLAMDASSALARNRNRGAFFSFLVPSLLQAVIPMSILGIILVYFFPAFIGVGVLTPDKLVSPLMEKLASGFVGGIGTILVVTVFVPFVIKTAAPFITSFVAMYALDSIVGTSKHAPSFMEMAGFCLASFLVWLTCTGFLRLVGVYKRGPDDPELEANTERLNRAMGERTPQPHPFIALAQYSQVTLLYLFPILCYGAHLRLAGLVL